MLPDDADSEKAETETIQPVCKGCRLIIESSIILQAVDGKWHQDCFRCTSCRDPLSSWYIEKAGRLYCKRDFWSKFGHLCNGCTMVISGPVMVAGEHRYHPECFQCCHCHSHVGEGESYALVERSALFCGRCYHLRFPPNKRPFSISATSDPPLAASIASDSTDSTNTSDDSSTTTFSIKGYRRRPHTIQMVEVPPLLVDYDRHHSHHRQQLKRHQRQKLEHQRKESPLNTESTQPLLGSDLYDDQEISKGHETKGRDKEQRRALQLSILEGERDIPSKTKSLVSETELIAPRMTISKLENVPELQYFQVGDRILEVDGSPVKEESVQEVADLLNNHASPLHVMLERDPSPIRFLFNDQKLTTSPSSSSDLGTSSPESTEAKTVIVQDTPVQLRPKASLKAKGHSPSRRRSKSPSPCPTNRQRSADLTRSHSFSSDKQDHRVFRAIDLIEGDVLGQGFFGKAIKAKHRITGEFMVLKELHNFDEDAQKGFLREVSMLRNLKHPCVLKFMGVLYRDKKLTLVTEFISGGTLSDFLLDTSYELSWLQRLKLAKDIAAGMDYLHSMDIIHRDLNSNNCFIRKDQSVVVADFGLAKIVPRHEFQKLTTIQEGKVNKKSGKSKRFTRRKRQTVVGNPYWMAPEMITKGVYDEKVDVFSYGVIVCETIARVTADPDYMPRSLDLGINIEAFHSRFCQNTPEPYVNLAALCSDIEPDQRPSFEEILLLCEALHLHLEHGRAVPQELQGSAVESYRRRKERLYGIGYKDVDSVEQAEAEKNQKDNKDNSGVVPVPDNAKDPSEAKKGESSCSAQSESSDCISDKHSSLDRNDDSQEPISPLSPTLITTAYDHENSTIPPCDSHDPTCKFSSHANYSETHCSQSIYNDAHEKLNSPDPVEKVIAELTLDNLKTNTTLSGSGAAYEDFAYYSCSSLSQSPSASSTSLCTEDFNNCKVSPAYSFDTSFTDCNKMSSLDFHRVAVDSSSELSHSGLNESLVQEVRHRGNINCKPFPSFQNGGATQISVLNLTMSPSESTKISNTLSPNSSNELGKERNNFTSDVQGKYKSTISSSVPKMKSSNVGILENGVTSKCVEEKVNSSFPQVVISGVNSCNSHHNGSQCPRYPLNSTTDAAFTSSIESSVSTNSSKNYASHSISPEMNSHTEPTFDREECSRTSLLSIGKMESEKTSNSVMLQTSTSLDLNNSCDGSFDSSFEGTISPINDSSMSSSRRRRKKMKNLVG